MGESAIIKNIELRVTDYGDFQVVDRDGNILWNTGMNKSKECESSGCGLRFQVFHCFQHFSFNLKNDGNLVLYTENGGYWSSGTWNNNVGFLQINSEMPHIQVFNGKCSELWSTPHPPTSPPTYTSPTNIPSQSTIPSAPNSSPPTIPSVPLATPTMAPSSPSSTPLMPSSGSHISRVLHILIVCNFVWLFTSVL